MSLKVKDDEWLREARMRAQRGVWERDAEEIYAELRRRAPEVRPEADGPPCPYCTAHPPMQRFYRYELQTVTPLWYCTDCYGFWATGDSLARGVADSGMRHAALEQVVAPWRCRSCHGRLDEQHICRKCGEALPLLKCPGCSETMERFERDGLVLDQCGPCRGTWFDVGEISVVYNLKPYQGLAASTVDETAADDLPGGWMLALDIASRLAFPFLPFRLPF